MSSSTHHHEVSTIDLTGVAGPPGAQADSAQVDGAVRAEVLRLAEEVEAAADRLAPLLETALARLAEVDALVCAYSAAEPVDDAGVEARYAFASEVSGHARLFDALQTLSTGADAYLATSEHHPHGVPISTL